MCTRLLVITRHFSQIFLKKRWKKLRALLETSQLFDNNSDFTGSDSCREEGEEVYAYRGPNFSASNLEQDPRLDETHSCKY